MNRALIIVDMQVDFDYRVISTKEAERIVPAVVKRLKQKRKRGTDHFYKRYT